MVYVSGILIEEKLSAMAFTEREVVGAACAKAARRQLQRLWQPADAPQPALPALPQD